MKQHKKGSLGITVVMLVFCLMMSFAVSYHKMIQTEALIHTKSSNSDRALDAAFSGISYAIAVIQTDKGTFTDRAKVLNFPDRWTCLDKNMKFTNYYDEKGQIPPYRFKVNATQKSKDCVFIKSLGEYIEYSGDIIMASYTAQLIAECVPNKLTKTIKLKRYKRIAVNKSKLNNWEHGTYDEYN